MNDLEFTRKAGRLREIARQHRVPESVVIPKLTQRVWGWGIWIRPPVVALWTNIAIVFLLIAIGMLVAEVGHGILSRDGFSLVGFVFFQFFGLCYTITYGVKTVQLAKQFGWPKWGEL